MYGVILLTYHSTGNLVCESDQVISFNLPPAFRGGRGCILHLRKPSVPITAGTPHPGWGLSCGFMDHGVTWHMGSVVVCSSQCEQVIL